MDKLLFVCCLATLVCLVQCKTLIGANAETKDDAAGTGERPEVREETKGQARQWGSVFNDAVQCGFDMACFLDATENDLRQQKQLMMSKQSMVFL